MAPWREQALARGYRSSGAFPLRIGAKVVGALTLYAYRPEFFTAKEIALLTSLADNLSFALESLDREAKRRRAEEALADHAKLVHDLYNHAPCGYHSIDGDGTFVQINDTELAWLGYSREEVVGRLKFSDLLTPDSLKVFQETFPGTKERGWAKDLEYEMVRKDGTVFPVLLSATAITDQSGNFLMTRSTLFDITERKRAEEALKESEWKLRYLAEQLLTAQENERKRLASELHDELGHALLALKLSLSSINKKLLPDQVSIKEEIQFQLEYIKDVIEEVRRLYHDLSPGDLEDLGLTSALENLVENFAGLQGHIICKVDLPDLDQLFSLPVQTVIYRTVQEALTNIGKHAEPEHITVGAVKEGSQVHFAIQDDGRGFDVGQVLGGHGAGRGMGLAAMKERLNMVGGSFAIQSQEQEGTRLTFTIPILPEGERP
jgi:PAS domain S-box-containing protein